MYTVRLVRGAQRAFGDADSVLQRKLERCWDVLAQDPRRHPNIRKLKGKLAAYWRFRVGATRVIYRIAEPERTVWIAAIDHRREAYR